MLRLVRGRVINILRKFINFTKTNWKYRWEKIPEHGGKLISIFCAGQFQFDAFYSMILDFVSISVYWQLTSLFTSRIGQLWNLARLNDVRGISMLSAKIGVRRKQVTVHDITGISTNENNRTEHSKSQVLPPSSSTTTVTPSTTKL